MNTRYHLKVFTAAAKLGFKEVFAEPIVLLGSFFTYFALVVAYGSVFRGVPPDDLTAHHLTLREMIWYFGTTEFVLFCSSSVHFREVQHDIQTEQIHLSFLRPCPVWIVRLGEWSGLGLARTLALIVPCFALTGFMAGGFMPDARTLAGICASLPLAEIILLCCYFLVGVSCLWTKQSEPVFWIWQKFMFFFGALLFPFALYPGILRHIVWLTPFPAILATPGRWNLDLGHTSLLGGLMHQVFWAVAFLVFVAFVDRAVLRRIQSTGE